MKAIEKRTEAIARFHDRVFGAQERRTSSRPLPREIDGELVLYKRPPQKRAIAEAPGDDPVGRMRRGKKGAKFEALYDRGDWQGEGYPSQSEADLALCSMLAVLCSGEAARVDALFRSSALMRQKWDERHFADGQTYGEKTVATATEAYRGAPTLAESGAAARPMLPDLHGVLSLTHAHDRLMDRHPHDLMWSHIGAGYVWTGSLWKEDRQATAERWADDVAFSYKLEADRLYAIASALEEEELEADLVAALRGEFPSATASGKRTWDDVVAKRLRDRADALIAMFKRLERPAGFAELLGRIRAYHTRPVEDLDAKPLLLACPNGTVDLRTGLIRPADRGDLITKVTSVEYVPGFKCSAWDDALYEWTNGDPRLARYLQVAFGYSLLGNPTLGRYCFMLLGPGQSGRSALLETLAAAVGDYGSSFSWRAFEHKKGASHDEDLAGLRGARFIFSNEAGDVALDTEKLKAVTSGEEQYVSRKHEPAFRMRPTFVVWAATNKLPKLPSDDPALWTRIRVVPFRRVFPVSAFRARLAADPDVLKAALACGVAGAQEYLERGLPACDAVEAATSKAQRELNPSLAWRTARAIADATAWTRVGELFDDYKRWCDAGEVPMGLRIGDREFGKLLVAWGFEARGRNGARGYLGVRLRESGDVVVP